jgi:integrase/recombinase XerD
MGRIAGRGRLPRTYPPGAPVIQTDRLCAAGTGQQDKDRGQAPPESAGTVQRGNQNEPRERSRPAEHVRRPSVPAESPTLGFTHLQFEALLTAARQSPDPCDFALVAMLGLLALRIFEATGADIADLGEEHGHRVLRVCGKGTKIVLVPLPPAVGRAIDRAAGSRARGPILLNTRGARMDPHAATRRLRHLAETAGIQIAKAHPHMLRHTFVTTMFRRWRGLARCADRCPPRRPAHHDAYDRARQNLDRHPNYILAAYMASGT